MLQELREICQIILPYLNCKKIKWEGKQREGGIH